MKMQKIAGLSRRRFLQGLVAVGIPLKLDTPLADQSDAQIDELWESVSSDPIVFEVDDRTIYLPGVEYPSVYRDVVDIRSSYSSHQELLDDMGEWEGLYQHFEFMFLDAKDAEDDEDAEYLDECSLPELQDYESMSAWIQTLPLERINAEVQQWLEQELPLGYEVPLHLGPMGEAYGFFQGLEYATLKALGVVVVEGEHPGSSYYGAELRRPVEEANKSAELLGIPIRFHT